MPTINPSNHAEVFRSAQTGRPILFYTLRLNGRLLEVSWAPALRLEEALEGIYFVFDTLTHYCTAAFLVDTSGNDSLDWGDLVPILQYEQYPRAIATGLRWKASVVAANPMDALPYHALHREIDSLLHTALFQDIDHARAWLLEKLGVPPSAN